MANVEVDQDEPDYSDVEDEEDDDNFYSDDTDLEKKHWNFFQSHQISVAPAQVPETLNPPRNNLCMIHQNFGWWLGQDP